MSEIIFKHELEQPFKQDFDSFNSINFTSIYPFADAGEIGSRPTVIPDLLGNHNIDMTYGNVGGLVGDGALQLADNGSNTLNTYGIANNFGATWASEHTQNSRFYLLDFVYKTNTKDYQYLASGHLMVRFVKSTNTLDVFIENNSSHGIRLASYLHGFADGERVVIAIQMDKTSQAHSLAINGVDLTSQLTVNGNPYSGNTSNQTPLADLRIGRASAWSGYYGFDGHINIFAFAVDFNGSELSIQQMLALTDNPYQLFKTRDTVQQEYGLVLNTATQYITHIQSANKSTSFTLEFSYTLHEDDTATVQLIPPISGLAKLVMDYNHNLTFDATWSSKVFSASHLNTRNSGDFIVRIVAVSGTVNAYINDELLAETLVGSQGFKLPTELLKFSKKTTVRYINFISQDFPDDSRYWEFNQTTGVYVKDHYNGAIATLVGFPADSGYVRAWGVGDGLEFDGSQYVSVPPITLGTNYEITVVATLPVGMVSSFCLLSKIYNTTTDYFRIAASGDLAFSEKDSAAGHFNGATTIDGEEHTYTIRVGTSAELLLDGVQIGYLASGSTFHNNMTFGVVGAYWSPAIYATGVIKSISIIDNITSANSRNYDFTKISGNSLVVPDTISGQDGTMVGFPANGVFVPERNKVLAAQEFDGVSQHVRLGLAPSNHTYEIVFASNLDRVAGTWQDIFSNSVGSLFVSNINTIRWGNVEVLELDGVDMLSVWVSNVTQFIGSGLDNLKGKTLRIKPSLNTGNVIPFLMCKYDSTNFIGGAIKSVSEFNTSSVITAFYDFTQEAGDTILDTSGNANHGTVVGGSLRRLYDYTGYGEIVGYQFDGVGLSAGLLSSAITVNDHEMIMRFTYLQSGGYVCAPFSGRGVSLDSSGIIWIYANEQQTSYNIGHSLNIGDEITLKRIWTNNNNGTYNQELQIGINGAALGGNLSTYIGSKTITTAFTYGYLDFGRRPNTIYSKCIWREFTYIENSVILANYDFTTGDQDQIIDTVGNNHATITNASTVKWQPIVPVDVFTVGTDVSRDYPDIVAWGSAVYGNVNRQKALCYGTQNLTVDFDIRSGFVDGGTIEGAGDAFVGDFSNTNVAKITGVSGGWLLDIRVQDKFEFKNLILDPLSSLYYQAPSAKYTNVGITKQYYQAADIKTLFTDCVISVENTHAIYAANGTVNLNNSVIRTNGTGQTLRARNTGTVINITNGVIQQNGASTTVYEDSGTVNTVATISSDAESGVSTNFTGAFVDDVSGDYRINQAWADTHLVGKGWNGSDIASWAYYVEAITSGINLLNIGANAVLDVKYYDGASLVDVVLQVNGTVVWQI